MRRLLPALLLAAALGGCHRDSASAAEGKSDGGRAVSVSVVKADHKDVPIWMEGLAAVSAWQQVTVRAQVDGRLDKIFFQEGKAVKKGELLAQIDPRPFDVQLKQAEGALARDSAQLLDAKINLDRYQTLIDRKLVAQQQVDDQRALAGQAAGNVKVDEAAIESAKLNLDYARVRAPIDGVVGMRVVDVGNLVHAADAGGLVVLAQLDPVAVFVTVPQDDLGTIAAAMARGEVPVEIQGREGANKIADGVLFALDNQINTSTATLRVKVKVPNPDHRLWPNQFVKARFLVDTVRGATVVQSTAVQRGPQGSFIYVVGADMKVAQTPVEIVRVADELTIITGAVQPGDNVVVDGQAQLRPGATVTIRGQSGGKRESAGHAKPGP